MPPARRANTRNLPWFLTRYKEKKPILSMQGAFIDFCNNNSFSTAAAFKAVIKVPLYIAEESLYNCIVLVYTKKF